MTHRIVVLALAGALITGLPGCAAQPPLAATESAAPATATTAAAAEPAVRSKYFEKIESTATADDAERLVCRREAPPGTRVKQTICRTQAQRQQAERDARRKLGRVSAVPVTPPHRP